MRTIESLASSPILRAAALSSVLLASGGGLIAAPIPGLFNTGVDANGNVLANGATDPHYRLTQNAQSPGSQTAVAQTGIPAPPWIANSTISRWIGPQVNPNAVPGTYAFETTFDLTGFDPEKAVITGRWATDDGSIDVLINGVSTGITSGGFTGWSEFTINFGFIDGVNTLEFILSNGGEAANPTGLRVEMTGTVELPDEPPTFRTVPQSVRVIEGDFVQLRVQANGTPPLSYQWQRNGEDIDGATSDVYEIPFAEPPDTGDYTVVVTNSFGQAVNDGQGDNPPPARVSVLQGIPGFYPTGVDDNGLLLDDYEIDPHYQLVINPDSESPDAFVQDSTVFPINDGTWLANGPDGKWIGPRGETSGAAGGDYSYRLVFDLTGYDPDTVLIRGIWTTDNQGLDIRINGTSTGVTSPGAFGTAVPFEIPTATYINGLNTIDFVINNAGTGYTGLRIEQIEAAALPGGGPGDTPEILRPPLDETVLIGESVQLTVLADGPQPLGYQWRLNGEAIPGQTGPTLFLFNASDAIEGDYDVIVTGNTGGSITSDTATVTVLPPVVGLYNTGVDAQGNVLADDAVDPHYEIIINPNDPLSAQAFAQSVIPSPPWVENSDTSRWIGPLPTADALPGVYTYRLAIDLSGYDAETMVLKGSLATDDAGLGIFVNGNPTSVTGSGGFTGYFDFAISGVFQPGINTVDFRLENGGAAPNPTGLRVENLRGGAEFVGGVVPPPLSILQVGTSSVIVTWPAPSPGWSLYESTDGANWAPTQFDVVVDDDLNIITAPISTGPNLLFRLQR